MAYLSTYNLKDVMALKAPAPAWRYVSILPALVNTNRNAGQIFNPMSVFSMGKLAPNVLVESFEVTHLNLNSVQRYYSARTINFPGRLSVSSFSINFYETEDYNVTDYLTLWRNNVVNDAGNFGLPKDYKQTVRLLAFDSCGKNTALFTLDGVYPESINSYQYDSGSSDRLKVSCTFSVDTSTFQKGVFKNSLVNLASSLLNTGNVMQLVADTGAKMGGDWLSLNPENSITKIATKFI